MSYSAAKVYRYLRFKGRFVTGAVVARHMGIALNKLEQVYDYPGLAGMGPCYKRRKKHSQQFWRRYAKCNAFCADFICFFQDRKFNGQGDGPLLEDTGKYLCIKDRPLRKGKSPPKRGKRK
jgi:hypothetical protein